MNKICTSIEQSKKLIELGINVKTADMHYSTWTILNEGEFILSPNQGETIEKLQESYGNQIIPAWSLVALLDILPNEIITDNRFECHYQIHIRKYDGGDNTTLYQIAYGNNRGLNGSWHDMINTGEKENLIDCCVQMILKLHEFKML